MLRSSSLDLNAFDQKKREIREALIKHEAELSNTAIQIDNMLMPEKENILKIIRQHDKETETFETEIGTLKTHITGKEEELKEKRKIIKELEDLLSHPKKILGVITQELSELRAKFGTERRTKVFAGEVDRFGRDRRVRLATVIGGVGMEPQIRALRGGCQVVIATPGRLLDHMERGTVRFGALQILVRGRRSIRSPCRHRRAGG